MAQITASTTPALIKGWLLVQNLGPSAVYADTTAAGTASTGLKIEVNGTLELRGGEAYVYTASATSDLRYV